MGVKLHGFDELMEDISNMAAALDQGPAVNRALEAGAEPIEQQMRSNATTDPRIRSGALHGAIHTGEVRGGSRGKRITIGVHRKDWSQEEYYPAYVEYGHGGPHPAPPHPYVRPAFDTKAEEAYREIKRVLSDELRRH